MTGVRCRSVTIVAGGLLVVLSLLFAYTSWGNRLLGTAPVSGQVWVFLIPFALALIVLEEFRKYRSRCLFQYPAATPVLEKGSAPRRPSRQVINVGRSGR